MSSDIAQRVVALGRPKLRGCYVLAFVFFALLLDFNLEHIFEFFNGKQFNGVSADLTRAAILGFVLGQCCFAAVLCGLWGRSWIDGLLLGCVVGGIGCLAIIVGSYPGNGWPPREVLVSAFFTPGIVFAATIPMLLARHFQHWQLGDPARPFPKIPVGLGNLFVNMTVIACVVLTAQAPIIFWKSDPIQYWAICGTTTLAVSIIAALVTLPASKMLNIASGAKQMMYLSALAAILTTVSVSILLLAVPSPPPRGFFVALPLTVVMAAGTLFVGFRAIRSDGLQLLTRNDLTPEDQLDPRELQLASLRRGRRTLLQVSLIIAAVVGLNIFLGSIRTLRTKVQKQATAVRTLLAPTGGSISLYSEDPPRIYSINLVGGDDSQLRKVIETLDGDLEGIQYLNFAGSGVSDACLADVAMFPSLITMNVSNTTIDGTGFAHLTNSSLRRLNGTNLDLTKAEWDKLPNMLSWLTLDGSKLNSEDFSNYLRRRNHLMQLSLSRVAIDDTIVAGVVSLLKRNQVKLDLSHTPLTDEQFRSFGNATVPELNLAGTQLTDASIDTVLSISLGDLNLSNTGVTDAGLARLDTKGIHKLNLSGTTITGAGFANWQDVSLLELNLSDTAVTDERLANLLDAIPAGSGLGTTAHMNLLNLANTNVSDIVVSKLVKLSCNKVVIAGTKITAANLAKASKAISVHKVHQWEVGVDQFTPQEVNQLEVAGLELVFQRGK